MRAAPGGLPGSATSRPSSSSRLVRALLSVGLLSLVLALADWRAVVTVLREVRPGWLGVALLLAFMDRIVITWRFRILLAARGIATGFLRLLRVQLAATFFGAGTFPAASGTFGSMMALPFGIALLQIPAPFGRLALLARQFIQQRLPKLSWIIPFGRSLSPHRRRLR